MSCSPTIMTIMPHKPLIRVALLAAVLITSAALAACSIIPDRPRHKPSLCRVDSAQAPDLLSPPVLGPSTDLVQGLTKPDDASWHTRVIEARAGSHVLATVQWLRTISQDPVEMERGPLLLRGVSLADGTIPWTHDLSEILPPPPRAGWWVGATSNALDSFALVISDARLPYPDDPATPAVLLTIDARTGAVKARLDDAGRPGGSNTQFLAYQDGMVAISDGQTVYGARDTDLITPMWQHPWARFGDTVINGLVLTADGYVDVATGKPTGLGSDVSSTEEAVFYLGVEDQAFRLSNPAPPEGKLKFWEPGPVMLVDSEGAPLWPEPWTIISQQIAVGAGLAVMECSGYICAIDQVSGDIRWTHKTAGSATVHGVGWEWVFMTEQTPDDDYLDESMGLVLQAGDGSTALEIPMDGYVFEPFLFGGCTVYTTETDANGGEQFVARDMRTDDLQQMWAVPNFRGYMQVFDGVMLVLESSKNRLTQIVAS